MSQVMDVHSESLENLLASLRQYTSSLTPIPALPPFSRSDVIEIQGPASSGKTHLLYHILLSLLVPASVSPRAEIAAIVYDLDAAFDVQRFRHLLLSRISRLPSSTLNTQEHVRWALARLHLFRPTSLAQLAASIANLPVYHSSHMPNQEIAMLTIDSISTFCWTDRYSAEQLRNIASVKDKGVPIVPSLHHVLAALQGVRHSHAPLVVLTNWALTSAPSHSESLYKQHLHLFPVIEDGITDICARALSNIKHSSSSPFPLTYHITMLSPSPDPFPAVPNRDAYHGKEITNNSQVYCLARSCQTRDAVRFIFQITDDDTRVHLQQLTGLTS